MNDHRGPYGVILHLPPDARVRPDAGQGPATDGSVEEWAHGAVGMRALEAHAASRNRDRPYSPDGVWWLLTPPTV